MCVSQVIAALATTKVGEATAEAIPAEEEERTRSFIDSFKQSGGNSQFFVGCDCGTAGCVIFDQGKELVCLDVKVK